MSITSTLTYKLKSSKHGNTVSFPGKRIKGGEVAILIAEKLECESDEVDLFVDGIPVRRDEDIPAYTQVEVIRKNVVRMGRPPSAFRKTKEAEANDTFKSSADIPNLPTMAVGEEDALDAMKRDVGFEKRTAAGGRGGGSFGPRGGGGGGFVGRGGAFTDSNNGEAKRGPPPPNYICHACGKGGHYIQDCPERFRTAKRINSAVGISSKQLEAVSAGDPGPKYAGANGQLFRRVRDAAQLEGLSSAEDKQGEIPLDLLCPWCGRALKEAILMPCCGCVACNRCVDKLVDSDGICKACEEEFMLDQVEPCEKTRAKYKAWAGCHGANEKRPRE